MLIDLGEASGIRTLTDDNYTYLVMEFHSTAGKYAFQHARAVTVAFVRALPRMDGIGVSVCTVQDRFDRERGIQIATGRARKRVQNSYYYIHKMTEDGTLKTHRSVVAERIAEQWARKIDKRQRERDAKKFTVKASFKPDLWKTIEGKINITEKR